MASSSQPLAPSATSPFEVLVFSRTCGYRHESIQAGIDAIQRLASESSSPTPSAASFTVHATEDSAIFAPEALARFRAIVLLQASGDFLDADQLAALQGFVREQHGGVVGVHCASNGMPGDASRWYARMIGAAFSEHPEPQDGVVRVVDPGHVLLSHGGVLGLSAAIKKNGRPAAASAAAAAVAATGDEVGDGPDSAREGWTWRCHDEWYNFKENPRLVSNIHVLMTADESTYEGGKHGEDHPLVWCQEDFEGARTYYTALGHFDEAYSDPAFVAQLRNAILWTARVL